MVDKDSGIIATKEHCLYCFDVLSAALNKEKQTPKYPSQLAKVQVPLFVTWHINGDDLRGCIGTFSATPIEDTLPKYALISALKDTRFQPISAQELPYLNVSVSLLVNFQNGKKWDQWEVGKHGIIIEFQEGGEAYNATYLPEVASEQQWDKETAVKSLVRKAGYTKNYKNVLNIITLTTYESSKYKVDFKEWQDSLKK